jgi:hypothetical protein
VTAFAAISTTHPKLLSEVYWGGKIFWIGGQQTFTRHEIQAQTQNEKGAQDNELGFDSA